MAFLARAKRGNQIYYQIREKYKDGDRFKQRILLSLGSEPISNEALLKWWEWLGKPTIPFKPERYAELDLDEIYNLSAFLSSGTVSEWDRKRIIEALAALSSRYLIKHKGD